MQAQPLTPPHAHRATRHDEPDRADDAGFTLVELVIAIGIIAFVFAAVAGILTSSLKALAIQKARTQGNEVATQAIEDLQRRSFDDLVLCESPTGTAPSGLDDTVEGSGCPPSLAGYGENPCTGANPADAPDAQYECTRNGITYTVKRYIAWVDEGHTSKRLAVFVTWNDSVGLHEVSQQSSLRAPSAASIIGLANPKLTMAGATDPNHINDDGSLAGNVFLSVQATDMSSTDRVFAEFWNFDADGIPFVESVALSSGNGTSWSTTLTSGFSFGHGAQFVTFKAVRLADGKTTATISPRSRFCKPVDISCASSSLPKFLSTSAPATLSLTASGGLTADFTVSAETTNIGPTGQVQVLLPTVDGVHAVNLQPAGTCTYAACTWSTVVAKSLGYSFETGTKTLAFSAVQSYVAGSAEEQGSTESDSRSVTFT